MNNYHRVLFGFAALALMLAFAAAAPAAADTKYLTSSTVSSTTRGFTGWMGVRFTTGSVVAPQVTQLGRYCVSGNSASHILEIVKYSDKSIVASVTVSMQGATPGQFV